MARLGMVIDLSRCIGCGACALACKIENNTPNRADGQSHNWADMLSWTEGTFPDTAQMAMPVMCNHCTDAPCVAACPVEPKAMHKSPDGITLHDTDLCIGCRACQTACPYSQTELDDASLDGETYSVISFTAHDKAPHAQWDDASSIIPGCTSSPAETAQSAQATPPSSNDFDSGNEQGIHRAGVVGKCNFCYHRTSNGLQPACVGVCPTNALIFDDQDDPDSEISKVLQANESFRLREEEGTQPNVHYIGEYSVRT